MPGGNFSIAPAAGVAADPFAAEAGTAGDDPIAELRSTTVSGRASARGEFGLIAAEAAVAADTGGGAAPIEETNPVEALGRVPAGGALGMAGAEDAG